MVGGDCELTYDYEHLGANASAIDDLLSGKSPFYKVFKILYLFMALEIISCQEPYDHCWSLISQRRKGRFAPFQSTTASRTTSEKHKQQSFQRVA